MNKENIINDLLPLYVENMLSEDSRNFVEENIGNYSSSLDMLADLNVNKDKKIDDFKPLTFMRKAIKRDKRSYALSLLMLVVSVFIIITNILFRPIHLDSDQITYKMVKTEDRIFIEFDEKITNFRLINDNGKIFIDAYTNFFDRIFNINKRQVLSINRNEVDAVIYENHNKLSKLLYGRLDGGVAILPRLVLSIYFKFSIFTFISLILIYIILKKATSDRFKKTFKNIIYLNFSFILSFLSLRGIEGPSFYPTFDFFIIVLLSLAYFALIISIKRLTKKD